MKEQSKRKFGFSNNQLKIIAMFSMLLDHIGVYLLRCAFWAGLLFPFLRI